MWDYSDNEFIKLNRKILKWEWYSDPCTRDLFIHCLLKANWKGGCWHGYTFSRGQFITSLPTLSQELGLSIQSIRTSMNHLKSTGELTDWKDNKIRIITVVNYNKYQSANRQINSPLTGNQQATNRQLTADIRSIRNIKNNKEEKKKDMPAALSDFDKECVEILGYEIRDREPTEEEYRKLGYS